MAAAATAVGPIRETRLNQTLFAGEAGIRTIQAAVDYARKDGGSFVIIIPPGYAGSESIASINGGTADFYLSDQRGTSPQNYLWSGAAFVPAAFNQLEQIAAPWYLATDTAQTTEWPAGSAAFDFWEPTDSARFMGRSTNANLASITLSALDAGATRSFDYLTCSEPTGEGSAQVSINVPLLVPDGILGPLMVDGDLDVTGILTVTGAVSLPGGITGPVAVVGNLEVDGNLTAANLGINGDAIVQGELSANSAAFVECLVDNSPVRTFANSPGGGGMEFPPAGIGVSTGTEWDDDSIDPATIAYLNTANTFALSQKVLGQLSAYGFTAPVDLSASNTRMGTSAAGNPILTFVNKAGPADQKLWANIAHTDSLIWSSETDAGVDNYWMQAFRTGAVVTSLAITPPVIVAAPISATATGDIPSSAMTIDYLAGEGGRIIAQSAAGSAVAPDVLLISHSGDGTVYNEFLRYRAAENETDIVGNLGVAGGITWVPQQLGHTVIGDVDLNNVTQQGTWVVWQALNPPPSANPDWAYITVWGSPGGYVTQIYSAWFDGDIHFRKQNGGVWTAWQKISTTPS